MTSMPMVRGKRMRATRLDGCGNVKLGPRSQVVTKGFVTVGLTANTEEGEAIQVTNASGELCVDDAPTPQFNGWTVAITFCGVDPELFTLMTGQKLVFSADGLSVVGFRVNSKIDASKSGFALELWTGIHSDACSNDGELAYGYLLVPFVKGGTIGDLTVENGAINFTLSNARSRNGTGWGVGPYMVTRGAGNIASPLDKTLDAGDHLHAEKVTVAPPEPTDGAVALGVPATGATQGAPATLTPTNSYPPETLTAAQAGGFTASPTSAWTAGNYVTLGDGTRARWTGTAWAAAA